MNSGISPLRSIWIRYRLRALLLFACVTLYATMVPHWPIGDPLYGVGYYWHRWSICYHDRTMRGSEPFGYYHSPRCHPMPGAGILIFEDLRDGYGRDLSQVYWEGQLIAGAHSGSFCVRGFGYASDRSRAYHEGRALDGIDVSTFQVASLDAVGFARDRSHILHDGKILEKEPAELSAGLRRFLGRAEPSATGPGR